MDIQIVNIPGETSVSNLSTLLGCCTKGIWGIKPAVRANERMGARAVTQIREAFREKDDVWGLKDVSAQTALAG